VNLILTFEKERDYKIKTVTSKTTPINAFSIFKWEEVWADSNKKIKQTEKLWETRQEVRKNR